MAAKTIKDLEAANARLHAALAHIAAFKDEAANYLLELRGSYSGFDEPASVQIARDALYLESSL